MEGTEYSDRWIYKQMPSWNNKYDIQCVKLKRTE